MVDLSGLVTGATYTGLGAILSPLIVALVQSRGKRGESRATAADLISNAAGGFVDRLNKDNIRQQEIIDHQRTALFAIIDALDDIIDNLRDLDGPTEEKIRAASRLARISIAVPKEDV